MADHYRVFISSTYLDSIARRKVVLEAIERAGQGRMAAVRMERFTADDRPTVEVCRARAAECELFVGIVAHRYGWEPEGQRKGEEKSITWLEYEAARAAGRPRLMFEIDPAAPFTLADLDPPPGTWEKRGKLDRFRAQYAKDQLPAFFNDDNLGMVVQQALVEWRDRRTGQAPSSSLGKYELLRKLATGGMAEVWLARQTGIEGFKRQLVIKRLLPHLACEEEFVWMFLNEARIASQFNHPNIVQIYDMGELAGDYFIAMELVHGEDLGRIMRKAWGTGQWIAYPLSIRIAALACEGLHYAHTRVDEYGRPLQVVHRDISPQNILVGFDGSVKLVDFGVAKAAQSASMTKAGVIKGKLAYMAPEQVAGKPLDHRADLFALGLTLYELLTGTRPLKRDSDFATRQAALECKIPPPSQVANVPPELDPIVMRAIAKRASDRYSDARQFGMALEEFLVSKQWIAGSAQISELMSTLFSGQPGQNSAEASITDPSISTLKTDPTTQSMSTDNQRPGRG